MLKKRLILDKRPDADRLITDAENTLKSIRNSRCKELKDRAERLYLQAEKRRDNDYVDATVKYGQAKSAEDFEACEKLFKRMGDYKDCSQLCLTCRQRSTALRNVPPVPVKTEKKSLWIVILVIALLFFLAVKAMAAPASPEVDLNRAKTVDFYEKQEISEDNDAFKLPGDFSDEIFLYDSIRKHMNHSE